MSQLFDKKTLVAVGPGGVGKTTTSAALAVHAALQGKKVLVLTVDPAKRLANSLGLELFGHDPVEIAPELLAEAGPVKPGGRLFAMMLDVKSTFDQLIIEHAPNPEVRDTILNHPFYEPGSSALAGSQEYMAMEKLYEIQAKGEYDLIILDTPPTANALDFLRAADRMTDFLDSRTAKWLIQGARAAGRFGLGMLKVNTFIARRLNRFVGADMFLQTVEFVQAFHEMYAGFKERATKVQEILRGQDVSFIIVSSTDEAAIDEAVFFHDQLQEAGMPFGAMLINRVRTPQAQDISPEMLRDALAQLDNPGLNAEKIEEISQAYARGSALWDLLSQSDQRQIEALHGRLPQGAKIAPIPLFRKDIHNIRTLSVYGERVLASL